MNRTVQKASTLCDIVRLRVPGSECPLKYKEKYDPRNSDFPVCSRLIHFDILNKNHVLVLNMPVNHHFAARYYNDCPLQLWLLLEKVLNGHHSIFQIIDSVHY